MSIFGNILEKLGIKKPAAPATPPPGQVANRPAMPGQMAPTGPGHATFGSTGAPTPAPVFAPKAAPMELVDVVSKLDGLAKANPEELNWKQSIVDLLKLLGMDASAGAIKELAIELGCPATELDDSYKRNVWTHKALLAKIAENGGNIPQNLLH